MQICYIFKRLRVEPFLAPLAPGGSWRFFLFLDLPATWLQSLPRHHTAFSLGARFCPSVLLDARLSYIPLKPPLMTSSELHHICKDPLCESGQHRQVRISANLLGGHSSTHNMRTLTLLVSQINDGS